MKQRILGKKSINVSEIGLGCWQLGGDWGDALSEQRAFEILQTALDQGITIFDTADVYGGGRSEEIIGKFLSRSDKTVKVLTKYGRGAGIYPDNYSEKSLREGVEGSLRRLGVDSLDLLQLHCIPTEVMEQGDIFNWLRELQSEGMINEFGASVETEQQGLLCMRQEGLLSIQIIFNIFRQHYIQSLLSEANRTGTGIIVRLPLASGLLTGKFNKKTQFSENDHRSYNRNGEAFSVGETFSGIPFEKGVELVQRIESDYLPKNLSMVEFALRWILDQKEVSCIIPGASSAAQAQSNAAVSDISPLSEKIHDQLSSFYKKDVRGKIRGVL